MRLTDSRYHLFISVVCSYLWSSSIHSWGIVCVWGSPQLNNGPVKEYSVFWAHFLFCLLDCYWKVSKSEQIVERRYLLAFFFFFNVAFLSSGKTEYRINYHVIVKFVWLVLVWGQGLVYLRLRSTLYASKDDFELLASNLSVVWCVHPFVWFCTVLGTEARVLHTKALSTN